MTLIVVGNEYGDPIQIQNEAVFISQNINTPQKSMHPTLHPQIKDKY